jgi:ribonuclease HI
MKTKKAELFHTEQLERVIRVFTDGSGSRPDGKGSAYGFLCTETGEKQLIREDGLTNNQAEYKAVILALESFPPGSSLEISTDSELMASQLNGRYKVRDPKIAALHSAAQLIIERKKLKVRFVWVPRAENLAGKMF